MVSGKALVDEVAQILPDGLAPVPIGDTQITYRVLGEAVEGGTEGFV